MVSGAPLFWHLSNTPPHPTSKRPSDFSDDIDSSSGTGTRRISMLYLKISIQKYGSDQIPSNNLPPPSLHPIPLLSSISTRHNPPHKPHRPSSLVMSKQHYIASTPPNINSHISPFFSKFYEISDNPSPHEEYAQCFTDTATVIMGRKKVQGYSDVCLPTSSSFPPSASFPVPPPI